MKNYYEILEVNPKASKEIIENAYKILIKRYHSDPYNSNQMKEISEAYQVLINDFLREQYDLELKKQEIGDRKVLPNKKEAKKPTKETNKKKSQVGSFSSLIEITKELLKSRPKKGEKREITQNDIVAIILTIIVVILIGVILWFVPFTNGWMRQLLFENPIFNWIGRIFSS